MDQMNPTDAEPREKLLPCPFCGSAPQLTGVYFECDDDMARMKVTCALCDVSQQSSMLGRDYRSVSKEQSKQHLTHHAVKEWNTRIASPDAGTGTPETDAHELATAQDLSIDDDENVSLAYNFARSLETRLAAALADNAELLSHNDVLIYAAERAKSAIHELTLTLANTTRRESEESRRECSTKAAKAGDAIDTAIAARAAKSEGGE